MNKHTLALFLILLGCEVHANEAFRAGVPWRFAAVAASPARRQQRRSPPGPPCGSARGTPPPLVIAAPGNLPPLLAILPWRSGGCGGRGDAELGGTALALRGGANFVPGQEVLTFGQSLAGSAFSLLSVAYGLACALAPARTAALLYGYEDADAGGPSKDAAPGAVKFLMRVMGTTALGVGLTAAFAVGAEVKVLGRLPKFESFARAIGVGLIPRALLLVPCALAGGTIPSSLRITRTDAAVALLYTALFTSSVFTGGPIPPDAAVHLEVAFHLLLGPLLFFRPGALFRPSSSAPSRRDQFLTSLAASYAFTGAVLLAGLRSRAVNALPAVGMAAAAWAASLVYLTFVRGDVRECGSSVSGHVTMVAVGAAVAAGGLRHYLVM